ncbi:nucleoside recognition domain-containing protein [Abyssisolibacter fermentans]|uniref:nucleoside recognition domain-containing protein n=1 Tax=Abyssisolibacter fermentans TaxID=1766203 RepID=UPI000B1B51BC|nr:nucleoside recognition domain-containing protein [Abyssisolibacter fermentans]
MSALHNVTYDEIIEDSINEIVKILKYEYVLSKRSIALLLLQEDNDVIEMVKAQEKNNYIKIIDIINKAKKNYDKPLNYVIGTMRQNYVEIISNKVVTKNNNNEFGSSWLDTATMNPISGSIILILVLYFGLYKFVGQFGAGTVVDYIETNLFGAYINPWVNSLVNNHIPWTWLQNLIANDYGILTLAFRYAIAIVLPIVGAFFLIFSIIEDSGYLPRLAMLVDRLFKVIGLNGRAVIPMVLGFGCDTMATMVSRTLETKRERVLITLLLALTIPCSAQLGVIMALLSQEPKALLVWIAFMVFVFLFIGYLSSKVLPGEGAKFYMEVPPLRMPKITNVLSKTYTRMHWYFIEIIPLFIFASVLIWLGYLTGFFDLVLTALNPIVNAIGLPDELSKVFLFGFFRRDYGAAGLFDMRKSGLLNYRQLVVAASTLTLFVPCIAQFAMMIKERGAKTAFAMGAFIFVFSFIAGYILNLLLTTLGVLA